MEVVPWEWFSMKSLESKSIGLGAAMEGMLEKTESEFGTEDSSASLSFCSKQTILRLRRGWYLHLQISGTGRLDKAVGTRHRKRRGEGRFEKLRRGQHLLRRFFCDMVDVGSPSQTDMSQGSKI